MSADVSSDRLAAIGQSMLEIGRYDQAADVFARAIALDPQDADLRCRLALARALAGEFAEALEAADAAVERAPGEEWPHRLRAIALGGLERRQEAVAAAETALECDPEEPAAHEVLADALLAIGRRDRARTVAQTGLELDPHRDGLAITLGDIALSLGQGREAERLYRHVLQHDPENAGVLANLGVALRSQGREGDAARAFEAAAKLDPHATFARERLTDGPAAMFGSGLDAALPALLLVVFAAYAISTGSLALVLIVAAVIATLAGVLAHQRRARREALSPAAREVLARQPWWRR